MSSFSMFGTCQGCGLTQYMQGQPCRDCGGTVQQGGVRKCGPSKVTIMCDCNQGRLPCRCKPKARECKSTYCECSDMNRAHCDALLTDAAIREQVAAKVMDQHTAFLNRAVGDCLLRLGLTLPEAAERLTRHAGPSWDELYLNGVCVLRVSWSVIHDSYRMVRTFHGPAELIPIT